MPNSVKSLRYIKRSKEKNTVLTIIHYTVNKSKYCLRDISIISKPLLIICKKYYLFQNEQWVAHEANTQKAEIEQGQ